MIIIKNSTWKKMALSAYTIASTFLACSCYAIATTQRNLNAIEHQNTLIEEHENKEQAQAEEMLSADSAAGKGKNIDKNFYGFIDWSQVIPDVMPSMVNISSIKNLKVSQNSRAWLVPGIKSNLATDIMDQYRTWYNSIYRKNTQRMQINSAGFVINDGKTILTTAHNLHNIQSIQVKIATGEWRKAHIIGKNQSSDVGLLKIEGIPLKPIKIASSLPRQGQNILAIGAPGGWGFSISSGIVSRYSKEGDYFKANDYIQIDAPITQGNSGGLVINAKGEAVGMVSYGIIPFTQTIPIDRALAMATILQRKTKDK